MENQIKDFEFIGCEKRENSHCPHCGAEGTYVYIWKMNGKTFSAMMGCFKKLTTGFYPNEKDRFLMNLALKVAQNKNLNGWEKNIVRLQGFKTEKKFPSEWCDKKINEVLLSRSNFLKGIK